MLLEDDIAKVYHRWLRNASLETFQEYMLDVPRVENRRENTLLLLVNEVAVARNHGSKPPHEVRPRRASGLVPPRDDIHTAPDSLRWGRLAERVIPLENRAQQPI